LFKVLFFLLLEQLDKYSSSYSSTVFVLIKFTFFDLGEENSLLLFTYFYSSSELC
jgi:hypothetical protein